MWESEDIAKEGHSSTIVSCGVTIDISTHLYQYLCMSHTITVSIRTDAVWVLDELRKQHLNLSGLVTDLLVRYCQDELGENASKSADSEMDRLVFSNPKIPMENRLKAIHRLQEYRRGLKAGSVQEGTLDLSDLEV